jgi:hypothetical protein
MVSKKKGSHTMSQKHNAEHHQQHTEHRQHAEHHAEQHNTEHQSQAQQEIIVQQGGPEQQPVEQQEAEQLPGALDDPGPVDPDAVVTDAPPVGASSLHLRLYAAGHISGFAMARLFPYEDSDDLKLAAEALPL